LVVFDVVRVSLAAQRRSAPGVATRPNRLPPSLPASVIHRPWSAAPLELADAAVELRKTYPKPIIDHKKGRERALDAYAKVRAA
jgi:hypothetical protein